MRHIRRVLTALALALLPLAAGSAAHADPWPLSPVAAAPAAQGGPGITPPR